MSPVPSLSPREDPTAPALRTPEPAAGVVASVIICLVSISAISGFTTQRILAIRAWKKLPFIVWLVLIIYCDSYLFVFVTGVLQFGFGINTSAGLCDGAILLCLVCYVTTKLIYLFLVERAYIIRGNPTPRFKSKLYIFNACCMLGVYVVISILNFVFRITRLDDGLCVIGMQKLSLIPLISFDVVVNIYLTILFLIPLKNLYSFKNAPRTTANIRLRTLALRTFIGACCTLVSSVVNLTVLMALDGEPGWVCLMCCNSDILFSAAVVQWVTSKDHAGTTSAGAADPNRANAADPDMPHDRDELDHERGELERRRSSVRKPVYGPAGKIFGLDDLDKMQKDRQEIELATAGRRRAAQRELFEDAVILDSADDLEEQLHDNQQSTKRTDGHQCRACGCKPALQNKAEFTGGGRGDFFHRTSPWQHNGQDPSRIEDGGLHGHGVYGNAPMRKGSPSRRRSSQKPVLDDVGEIAFDSESTSITEMGETCERDSQDRRYASSAGYEAEADRDESSLRSGGCPGRIPPSTEHSGGSTPRRSCEHDAQQSSDDTSGRDYLPDLPPYSRFSSRRGSLASTTTSIVATSTVSPTTKRAVPYSGSEETPSRTGASPPPESSSGKKHKTVDSRQSPVVVTTTISHDSRPQNEVFREMEAAEAGAIENAGLGSITGEARREPIGAQIGPGHRASRGYSRTRRLDHTGFYDDQGDQTLTYATTEVQGGRRQ